MEIDFEKILTVLLILFVLFLSFYVYSIISQTNTPPPKGKPFIPFTSGKEKQCTAEKVSCDPSEENSCDSKCQEPGMKCVKMNDEFVCLPREPDVNCNSQNGGKYVWTGYGFTQTKDWQCLCTHPEIFNGSSCDIKNPSYCSGGSIGNVNTRLRDICTCPKGTGLLFRYNNTPMCVSNDPQQGGGENGLYGNYYRKPDWKNVYFMKNNDVSKWANDIATEFNMLPNYQDIYNIIVKEVPTLPPNSTPSPYTIPSYLTTDIVNNLKNIKGFPESFTPFDPNYHIVVNYRYFDKTYIP